MTLKQVLGIVIVIAGAIRYFGPFPGYSAAASWLDFGWGICLAILLMGWAQRESKHEERLTGVVWVSGLRSPTLYLAALFVGWHPVSRAYEIITRPPGPPCDGVEICIATQSGSAITLENAKISVAEFPEWDAKRRKTIDDCQKLLTRDCYWGGLGNQPWPLVWSCGALVSLASIVRRFRKRPKAASRTW